MTAFLLTALFLITLPLQAQEADNRYEGTALQAYLEYCLFQREAMTKKSTKLLRECIEESTESDFRFNDIPIRLSDITDDIETVEAATPSKVEMYYTPDYVDELLMHDTDYRDDELEGPALMRDVQASNCMYTHQALGAGQTGLYRIPCVGHTRLICVPAPDRLISVQVTSESGVAEPFTLSDQATRDTPYTDCAWDMDQQGSVLLRVTNLSKKNTSFVIATD
ncbi:MAG: hypothetical protein K5778_07390 [Bacteroidaceae bacterium]|nr:hypothetical protein [Bacteroidaceae bacterium]